MRLDRYLCELNIGSRSQVREFVRKGLVSVNGQVVWSADQKIAEQKDQVAFQGKTLTYQRYVYYMLNKPRGVVSATQDNTAGTVVELLAPEGRKDLFPMGRLDKDTEGLLLLTNEGRLAHELLSPRRHVDKVYALEVAGTLDGDDVAAFANRLTLADGYTCLPADLELTGPSQGLVTLREGKYHQVKRMLAARGAPVLYLERIQMGNLALDPGLPRGAFRFLTEEEIEGLRSLV